MTARDCLLTIDQLRGGLESAGILNVMTRRWAAVLRGIASARAAGASYDRLSQPGSGAAVR